METNRQPEFDEIKLRERLEELLRQARVLEEVTRAPANLPRVTTPRPALPAHETFLPGSILTTLFRNPKTGRTVSFKREELGELDGMTTTYLLNYYQSQSLFTPDDALICIRGVTASCCATATGARRCSVMKPRRRKPSCAACCNCAC